MLISRRTIVFRVNKLADAFSATLQDMTKFVSIYLNKFPVLKLITNNSNLLVVLDADKDFHNALWYRPSIDISIPTSNLQFETCISITEQNLAVTMNVKWLETPMEVRAMSGSGGLLKSIGDKTLIYIEACVRIRKPAVKSLKEMPILFLFTFGWSKTTGVYLRGKLWTVTPPTPFVEYDRALPEFEEYHIIEPLVPVKSDSQLRTINLERLISSEEGKLANMPAGIASEIYDCEISLSKEQIWFKGAIRCPASNSNTISKSQPPPPPIVLDKLEVHASYAWGIKDPTDPKFRLRLAIAIKLYLGGGIDDKKEVEEQEKAATKLHGELLYDKGTWELMRRASNLNVGHLVCFWHKDEQSSVVQFLSKLMVDYVEVKYQYTNAPDRAASELTFKGMLSIGEVVKLIELDPWEQLFLLWVQDTTLVKQDGSANPSIAGKEFTNLKTCLTRCAGLGEEDFFLFKPTKKPSEKGDAKSRDDKKSETVIAAAFYLLVVGKSDTKSEVVLDYVFGDKNKEGQEAEFAPRAKGLQIQLGPLSIENIGLWYEEDKLGITLDATLLMGPIGLALIGFSIGVPFTKNSLSDLPAPEDIGWGLQGMTVSLNRPPLTVGGGFIHDTSDPDVDKYVGALIMLAANMVLVVQFGGRSMLIGLYGVATCDGGVVHVDFWVFGFDVRFGAPPRTPPPVMLDRFWAAVVKSSSSSSSSLLAAAASNNTFELHSDVDILITAPRANALGDDSVHITKDWKNQKWRIRPVITPLPTSVWAKYNRNKDPAVVGNRVQGLLDGDKPTMPLVTGLSIKTPEPAEADDIANGFDVIKDCM
ncbi:hypothetical protein CTA1_5136 [Colletotrichum tanaceti]|uniref:DUF6603 domain-containing protein n=1 Tax=Colletotrichum tanaceti TaxID=1306861 RepID=A0A4U6XGJ0_9PEZI|nr:hypothetical protein CTA1_5136 [Colletotrichum tanaceti]